MRKLMRANFYRLWKSRVFWICVAASFLISAAFLLAKQYPSQEMPPLDEMYLKIFPMLPLIHGVFAGLFLRTEYQDGTLRHKVTVGHTRGELYLSFLPVCLCAGLGILLGCSNSLLGTLLSSGNGLLGILLGSIQIRI